MGELIIVCNPRFRKGGFEKIWKRVGLQVLLLKSVFVYKGCIKNKKGGFWYCASMQRLLFYFKGALDKYNIYLFISNSIENLN